jgi:thioester reductase-like protein
LIENAKVPAHSIARELRLTDLGLDSLTIVELAGAMEERISVEVPVELVFDRSLGELEEWLETTRLPLTSIERPDLEAAASLAEEIRITTQPRQAGAIMLTGATGFLGAFLLAELLARQTGRVACLVRGADESRGHARLHATARRLGLALDHGRIDIVAGDLSKDALGLTTDELQRLAWRCRLIVHAAGVVDWSARFETLAQVNVGGTREIVRLSTLGGGVPIHHVSSLGVFPFGLSRRERFGESEQMAEGDLLRVPYFQSKWAAERLLERARLRKIPVSIYRPGFIGGHSKTGKELSAASQLFCAFVAGAGRMGAVPALEKMLDIVPVDYVASAVVALALQEPSASRSRNLVNPSPLPQDELYAILRRERLTLAPVPFGRWRERVLRLPREDAGNPLARFALYYRSLTPQLMLRIERLFAQRMPVDDEATRAELAALDILCPAFDAALVQTYVRAWEEAGVLRRDAERAPGPPHVARP